MNMWKAAIELIGKIASMQSDGMEDGGYASITIGQDRHGTVACIRHSWEEGEWSSNVSALSIHVGGVEVAGVSEETQCFVALPNFITKLVEVMRDHRYVIPKGGSDDDRDN